MNLTKKISDVNCVIVSMDNILFDAKTKTFVESPRLVDSVINFVKKNNKFIIFSSRNLIDVETTYKHLDLYDFCPYSIACNGSLIFDNVRKRKISHRYLTKQIIIASEELQDKFNEQKIPLVLGGYDGYNYIKICQNPNISQNAHREAFKSDKLIGKNNLLVVDSLRNKLPLVKLVWKATNKFKSNWNEINEIVVNHFNKLMVKPVIINDRLNNNIEVNMIGNSKDNAITELVNPLGIKPENCMFIGNGENDVALFNSVGFSVVSANEQNEHGQKVNAKITLNTTQDMLITEALSMLN